MTLSPLFQRAGAEMVRQAEREFYGTQLGRAVRTVEAGMRSGVRSELYANFSRAMGAFESSGVESSLRVLSGTSLGELAGVVQRYARGGGSEILQQFFADLGPAGRFLSALTLGKKGKTGDASIDRLIELVESLGFPVLRPGVKRTPEQLEAMAEELRLHGYTVFRPGEGPVSWLKQPRGAEAVGTGRRPQPEPETRIGGERFPPNHPIVTGQMVPSPESSNVHSFGYDSDQGALYVRFKRGEIKGSRARPSGPGSLYRYEAVQPREFLSMLETNSKGNWVWDHLRIRGTFSGHQKDYALVGIMYGYVPRKATVRPTPEGLGEWYEPRTVSGMSGVEYRSKLPGEWAWHPDRGTPDRGTPNRG